ncbi:hypothetical protein [Methylobacterium sp. WL120]|uniref:hypothetical protein n=1 Tax=Methylobacterium sp. WL120 TaxID=2603887 RepID=UPI0011CB399E|nr:hypothetical protein [Methylobacterium sp. WL120]TXM69662.1 hypothetical protein FV229_04775 [Methylobacterium sp. WL120]
MPRFVASLTIFAECEVEAATQAEANRHFRRHLGVDDTKPEFELFRPCLSGNDSGPVRLINTMPSLGMIGERVGPLG